VTAVLLETRLYRCGSTRTLTTEPRRLGSRVVILSPTPAARRVLELMGLDRVMDVSDRGLARRALA
jgi:anti-anti-sigma regulatory factor